MDNEIIEVKSEGYEEYWAPEYKCPYCGGLDMHNDKGYCGYCGGSFENVRFKEDKEE